MMTYIFKLLIYCINIKYIYGSWVHHNPLGFYEVPQGWCSVETRYGKIFRITDSGLTWKNPLTTNNVLVEIRWQTNYLNNVECISSQGETIYLDITVNNKLSNENGCVEKMIKEHGIEYYKILIKELISSEIVQFCKNYKLEDIYSNKLDKLHDILAKSLNGNIKAYGMEKCLKIKNTGGVRINHPKFTPQLKEKFEKIEAKKKERHIQEILKIISEADARKQAKLLEVEADDKWLTKLRIQYETALANSKNVNLVCGSEKSFNLESQIPETKKVLSKVFNE